MSELVPCPFCGKTAEVVLKYVKSQGEPWYGKRWATFVLCDCGACLFDETFHEGFVDDASAIAAWNRRAPSAEVERLRGEAILIKAQRDAATSVVLELQQECVQLRRMARRLRESLKSTADMLDHNKGDCEGTCRRCKQQRTAHRLLAEADAVLKKDPTETAEADAILEGEDRHE